MDLPRNQLPSNISSRNVPLYGERIPQLDGGTPQILYKNSDQYPQPKNASAPAPYTVCKTTFENQDGVKWHRETRYGQEDGIILRIMLPFS